MTRSISVRTKSSFSAKADRPNGTRDEEFKNSVAEMVKGAMCGVPG
jgi:hypothetical protein